MSTNDCSKISVSLSVNSVCQFFARMLTVPTSVLFRIHSRDGDEDGTAAFAEEALGAKPIAQAATTAAITPIPTPVENDVLLAVATPGGVTHVAREADALPTD
jgi:hypothetical protein